MLNFWVPAHRDQMKRFMFLYDLRSLRSVRGDRWEGRESSSQATQIGYMEHQVGHRGRTLACRGSKSRTSV